MAHGQRRKTNTWVQETANLIFSFFRANLFRYTLPNFGTLLDRAQNFVKTKTSFLFKKKRHRSNCLPRSSDEPFTSKIWTATIMMHGSICENVPRSARETERSPHWSRQWRVARNVFMPAWPILSLHRFKATNLYRFASTACWNRFQNFIGLSKVLGAQSTLHIARPATFSVSSAASD